MPVFKIDLCAAIVFLLQFADKCVIILLYFMRGGIFLDKELMDTLLQVVVGCAVIMIFIAAACLITPKLAKLIEKKYPQLKDSPERVGENAKGQDPEDYEVKGVFEPSKLEDFDPNYKIYNKDIYGVDFRHGKKERKNG